MAKKILKTLVNNLGFKILAVVLAFILWLVVYNIDDPKKIKKIYTLYLTNSKGIYSIFYLSSYSLIPEPLPDNLCVSYPEKP